MTASFNSSRVQWSCCFRYQSYFPVFLNSNILTKNYLKWTMWSIPGPHHVRSSRSKNSYGKINWLHKQVRGFVTRSKNPWANLFAFFPLRQFDFLNPHDLLFRHVRFSNSSFQFRLLIGLVDIQTANKNGRKLEF